MLMDGIFFCATCVRMCVSAAVLHSPRITTASTRLHCATDQMLETRGPIGGSLTCVRAEAATAAFPGPGTRRRVCADFEQEVAPAPRKCRDTGIWVRLLLLPVASSSVHPE